MVKQITSKDKNNAILEKVSIMIDIMMALLNKPYSDCYALIVGSTTYRLLVSHDISVLHDSPQANLIDIGKELREKGIKEGQYITEEAIKNHALSRLKAHNRV